MAILNVLEFNLQLLFRLLKIQRHRFSNALQPVKIYFFNFLFL